MNGTEGQQLFAFFFAVLYGGMLNGVAGLRAFPWGFMEDKNPKRLAWRLALSLILLNFVPLLMFAHGFHVLQSYHTADIPFWHVVLIGAATLSVFAPYRVYHLLLVALHEKPVALYTAEEYRELVSERGIRSARGQFLGACIYAAPLIFLSCIAPE